MAQFVLPDQGESGDRCLIKSHENEALVVVIDGIGHGKEAAHAAKATSAILSEHSHEPIISLVRRCHERLRTMRGVVLSLASIDASHGLMTWLGVGNVQGVLLRSDIRNGNQKETLLLRAGVVGAQLPPLQATVLPIAPGDTVYLATDGIRQNFVDNLSTLENPQRAANRILGQFQNGNDDALILVARMLGPIL